MVGRLEDFGWFFSLFLNVIFQLICDVINCKLMDDVSSWMFKVVIGDWEEKSLKGSCIRELELRFLF